MILSEEFFSGNFGCSEEKTDDTPIVGVYKINERAKTPYLATEMSACYELNACFHTETVKVQGRNTGVPVENFGKENAYIQMFPEELMLIPTGLIFILNPLYHMKIYSRSGNVWKKKLIVGNQPAIIDADYTKETFVLLHNNSNDRIIIKDGDLVGQCEVMKTNRTNFKVIDINTFQKAKNLIESFSSRNGGLGSTSEIGAIDLSQIQKF